MSAMMCEDHPLVARKAVLQFLRDWSAHQHGLLCILRLPRAYGWRIAAGTVVGVRPQFAY